LDFLGLPRFRDIRPGDVTPAVDVLIAAARETVECAASSTAEPSWENLVLPLSDAIDRLDRSWGHVAHLNAVVNTPALRETYNAFGLFIDDLGALEGVPEDVLVVARAAAQADQKPGWKLTLRMPCYVPVMQYAHKRAMREKLYRAYTTRASEFGDPAWDNSAP